MLKIDIINEEEEEEKRIPSRKWCGTWLPRDSYGVYVASMRFVWLLRGLYLALLEACQVHPATAMHVHPVTATR